MPKSNQNQKTSKHQDEKKDQVSEELELLKKENKYLRIELEYLKKLKVQGLKDPRANNKQR